MTAAGCIASPWASLFYSRALGCFVSNVLGLRIDDAAQAAGDKMCTVYAAETGVERRERRGKRGFFSF